VNTDQVELRRSRRQRARSAERDVALRDRDRRICNRRQRENDRGCDEELLHGATRSRVTPDRFALKGKTPSLIESLQL
jgi:hypothetical protein